MSRRRSGNILLCLAFATFLVGLSPSGTAQTRKKHRAPLAPVLADESTLPPDVSGMYEFDRPNEFIQITIEGGKLDGYISRLGDEQSDLGTPLTYFFDKTILKGDRLSFSTRQVHDLWYSFEGTIGAGPGAKQRSEAGYYSLEGTLVLHRVRPGAPDMVESRSVSFRSMRQGTLG